MTVPAPAQQQGSSLDALIVRLQAVDYRESYTKIDRTLEDRIPEGSSKKRKASAYSQQQLVALEATHDKAKRTFFTCCASELGPPTPIEMECF